MRAMKDSGVEWIGEIPIEWTLKRIKSIVNNLQNKQLYKGENYIGLENIESWAGKCHKSDNVGTMEVASVVNFFDTESILFGKLRPYLAKVFRPNFIGQCSTEFLVLKSTCVNKNYLFYCLLSPLFIDEINSLTCGVKMPRANWNNIGAISIPFPNIDEQKRIADYLDARCAKIDTLISQEQTVIKKLQEYKQSMITQVVTKGLNPDVPMKDSGVDWIGDIPADWEIRKIKYLFKLRNERNYLPLETINLLSLYTDIGVFPHGEQEERGNKAVSADGYKKVYKNDIVVNIILAWMGAIGISNYNGVTSPAYDIYMPLSSMVWSKYFNYLFRTKGFAGECYKYGRGIMSMRWRTYSNEFLNILVPVPTFSMQLVITEHLDNRCSAIDATISKKQTLIDKLTEYKKSLIYEVVTGKKEV